MKIRNRTAFVGSHKMWSLDPIMSHEDISALLGSNVEDIGASPDGKCTHEWMFTVDGAPCGIWDYKGARWSGYGPKEVFQKLGMVPEAG